MNDIAGAISSLTGAGATARTSARDKSALSQDEFFRIMITELTNQDPLEPLDNSEFLNQVSQMQTLETMTQLSKELRSLQLGEQVTSAGVLIGRWVTGVDTGGGETQGYVERVLIDGNQVRLGIGDKLVPIDKVREVAAF